MLLKKLGLIVGISSLLIACGPDCVSSCEQAQEDGACFREIDADGNESDMDCENFCEDVEEIASEDNGDCEEDLDELLSCMNDEDDACDALDDSCEDELDELGECISEFCTEHSSNNSCEDLASVD